MARRSSREPERSSLDLLLDTICNTFGGIVFIAILVVVLMNMTSERARETPPDRPSQAELIALERRLEAARHERRQLRAALAAHERTAARFSTAESRRLAGELHAARSVLAGVVSHRDELLASVTDAQTEINRIATELSERADALQQTRDELARVSAELQRKLRSRSRTASLPTTRDWNGDVAPFFLTQGRLCALKTSRGGFLRWNERECRLLLDEGRIEPIPSAGLAIDLHAPDLAAIEHKLSDFDPARHAIQAWVTPDSFAQFAALKEALVQRGFRYDIRPIPDDAKVGLTNAPTRIKVQ